MNQKNGEELKKNWYNEVNYWLQKLELKMEESEITAMLKSEWKSVVKQRISKAVEEEVTEKLQTTKLRFVEDIEKKDMREELGLLDAMSLRGGSGLVRDWGHVKSFL